MTNQQPLEIKINLRFTIPAGALEYETKEMLAVSINHISRDKVEGLDVEATKLLVDLPDKNGTPVRVNVLDWLGKSDIDEALFNQINNQ